MEEEEEKKEEADFMGRHFSHILVPC